MRVMRASQRGVTLSGLIMVGFVVAIVAVLGMKVAPDVIEYFKVKKDVMAVAAKKDLASVADVQRDFDRYADIDQISSVKGSDLSVIREGNGFAVSVEYERRIKLFGPVSLVLDFEASSAQ
jgi:hypothetical protein